MAAIQEQFTFQSAAITNGNGTAGDVSGLPGVCVQVEGITTASVVFEGRIGTLTYTGIQAVNLNDGSIATLTAADGLWYVPTAGLEDVRCRVSTYSGGTITVIGRAIYSPAGMTLADIDVAGAEAVTLSEAQWDDTDKLAVSLYGKTTAGGDTPLEMGQDTIAASLSVAPATNIADATYIGDIKFGEALPAGTALLGSVSIDQTTPGTTNKVVADPVTTTQTDYNVTLTNADTEYSQALPANCRGFEFQCRTEVAVRWSKTTGKVAGPAAPYKTLKAGDYYWSPPLNQAAAPDTLYFASASAGVIVELTAWT